MMNFSDVAIVRSDFFLKHEALGNHPENPLRLKSIYKALDSHPELSRVKSISLTSAVSTDLLRVHALSMVDSLASLKNHQGWVDADTFYIEPSIDVALLAAGSTVDLARKIWKGDYRRGFSLVRPPGHHATPKTPMGFCLYNNVAVAAAAIIAEKPTAKIAIVDFDLHHGNGTQDFFYGNENVLFISSHRFPYYPGTGALSECGEGKAKGTTLNFPIGSEREADEFFVTLYEELVGRMLNVFRPEMILVSAGYDGHLEDPMTGFRISDDGYRKISEVLIRTAEETNGKILFCLEGGYNPAALARSVVQTLEAMGEVPREKISWNATPATISGDSLALLDRFRAFHRQFFPEIG